MDDLIEIFETLNDLTESISGMAGNVASVIAAVLAIFGLINCFFGFNLTKFWISLTGFLIGILVGIVVGASIDESLIVILSLIFAVLFAFLAFKLYKLSIFIMILGYATVGFTVLLTPMLHYSIGPAILISFVLGIIIAIFGIRFVQPVIILSTAITGGLSAGKYILQTFHNSEPGPAILLGAVIAFLGAWFQFRTNKSIKNSTANINNTSIPNASVNDAGIHNTAVNVSNTGMAAIAPSAPISAKTRLLIIAVTYYILALLFSLINSRLFNVISYVMLMLSSVLVMLFYKKSISAVLFCAFQLIYILVFRNYGLGFIPLFFTQMAVPLGFIFLACYMYEHYYKTIEHIYGALFLLISQTAVTMFFYRLFFKDIAVIYTPFIAFRNTIFLLYTFVIY